MSFDAAERLARSLLFEGYVLYPYRPSSLKNRQRWAMGSLYPEIFCWNECAGDAHFMQTECLVVGEAPRVRVSVRFLQLGRRTAAVSDSPRAQGAVERQIDIGDVALGSLSGEEHTLLKRLPGGNACARAPETEALDASVTLSAAQVGSNVWRVNVSIRNETEVGEGCTREAALLKTLVSAHTLLGCRDGRFVSLLEPDPALKDSAAACKNVGTWPVLVGLEGTANTMLSSPIILYDHPSIAPESAGDLFDATEIDEILTLRILTLTEEERREVRRTDPRARALLDRTEALGEEELLALHGAWRPASSPASRPSGFEPGDHVILRPHAHGDVLDLALAGEPATIRSVEEDLEGRLYFTVTVDCDPGRDLGEEGQPGHRFFFSADELEPRP